LDGSSAASKRENSSASGPPGEIGAAGAGATGSGFRDAGVAGAGGGACAAGARAGIFQALTRVRSFGLAALSAAILACNPASHCRNGGFAANGSVIT
jgi:hypothetical protein